MPTECANCHKPTTDFYSGNRYCRPCGAEKKRQYYEAHHAEILAYKQAHRLTHLEQFREKDRKHHEAHREEHCEAFRQYYQTNREERKKHNRNYAKEHPEVSVNHSARRRAAIGDARITKQEWRQIMLSTDWHCFYCGTRLTNDQKRPSSRSIDHIIPLTAGGLHGILNIVPCCYGCNLSKSDTPWYTWQRRPLLSPDKERELFIRTLICIPLALFDFDNLTIDRAGPPIDPTLIVSDLKSATLFTLTDCLDQMEIHTPLHPRKNSISNLQCGRVT